MVPSPSAANPNGYNESRAVVAGPPSPAKPVGPAPAKRVSAFWPRQSNGVERMAIAASPVTAQVAQAGGLRIGRLSACPTKRRPRFCDNTLFILPLLHR